MIAEEGKGAAAGLAGLRLEGHQQVHHRARARAAVGVVAGLNELRPPAGPAPGGVGQPGRLENPLEAVELAVNVADGDDAGGGLGESGCAGVQTRATARRRATERMRHRNAPPPR